MSSALSLHGLPEEIQLEVLLELPPSHIYKLMQTNKAFYFLCRNNKYWARVAAHLIWRHFVAASKPSPDAPQAEGMFNMVLLKIGYKNAMETFIERVRFEMRQIGDSGETHSYVDNAALPVAQLASFGELSDSLEYMRPYTPIKGESMRAVVQRIVEDTENLPRAIERATTAMETPVRRGFISSERRTTRTETRFLHALDDDSCSLETKRHMLDYTDRLLHDMKDRRIRSGTQAGQFELLEEDMDSAFVYIKH